MSENVITVSALTKYIKSVLESDINLVNFVVSGEISNLTIHRTGHLYFALKDENSVINAVMFKSSASSLNFKPENGMKVIVKGKITVFEPAGRYQVMATSMQVDGIGDLYVAYELLKKKLEAEGLFSQSNKKQIPKIPKTVGVVTSPTGAAIRDIINVLGRRFPYSEVLLYPSLVQGEEAAGQIINALSYFETTKCADVVIVGRGGGSIEDLWAFNDEKLARFIFSMTVPVISAVGHEIDFTICDFVADLRAPTPSAAAEIAVPDTQDLISKFDNVNKRLKLLLKKKIEISEQNLNYYLKSRVFIQPEIVFESKELILDHNTELLYKSLEKTISKAESNFERTISKLDALSPLKVLSRGFLFAKNHQNRIIKSVTDINVGTDINLTLSDGSAQCTINEIIEGK